MSHKVKTWYNHPTLGKVKIVGEVKLGVVEVHQVYSQGVSMLFYEHGDKNLPCGFSRAEIRGFEILLSNEAKKGKSAKTNSIDCAVTEITDRQNKDYSGLRALLGLKQ